MTAALRAAAALLASLLTGVILVASAAPASAHATVVSSNPADGGHVDSVPDVLTVELSEPVTIVDGSASVITAEGERMRLSGVRLENGNRRVVIDPADGLGDNAYLATVRTVSADTHVISLSIRFTVGSVTDLSGIPKATEASSTALRWGWVAKTAVYLGVILTAGLLLAARMVWPEMLSGNRFTRTHHAGAVILLLGLLGRFIVLSAQHAGGLSAVTTDVAGDVLRTSAGWSIALAAVLNLSVACGVTRLRGGRYTGYLAAAGALTAVALGGHGGSADRWPVAFIDTLIHVYAMSVWLGGVAVLALLAPAHSRVARWHRVALGHVALVIVSGVILAVLQVDPVAALGTTTYGIVLLVKAGAVAIAVAAGFWAYRRYARTDTGRGVVIGELALVVVIAAATAVLSSTTPARDSYTTQVEATLDFGQARVLDVGIDTIRRGDQTITVRYRRDARAGGAAVREPDLDIELSSAEANVARLPVTVLRAPDGTGSGPAETVWRSDGLIVPAAGNWKVTVRFDGGDGPKLASFGYRVR